MASIKRNAVHGKENPCLRRFLPCRSRRFGRSTAGDAPVPSQDKKKEVYHRRSADAAGADRAFFLSCESRFFDLNLRKKGDENGNEPSSPSAAMQTHSLAACKMRWRAGTFLQSEKEQHIYEMLLDMVKTSVQ